MLNHDSKKGSLFSEGNPGIAEVFGLYSFATLVFLIIGSRVQRRELHTGLVITEFGLILLPALLLLMARNQDLKKVMRLNKLGLQGFLLIPWIMVFAIPVVGVFNLLNLWLVNTIFSKTQVMQIPSSNSAAGLLVDLLVIAVAPAVCEETLFRGVIMRGLEKLGTVKAILITSFLFALLHVDFQKLFGTFLLGVLIGFIVYRTNSLYGGMLAHFTNNAVATILSFVANILMRALQKSGFPGTKPSLSSEDIFSAFRNIPAQQLVITAIVWAFIILFSAAVLVLLIIVLIKSTDGTGKLGRRHSENGALISYRIKISSFTWVLPGLLLIAFIYFSEGLGLLGNRIPLVEAILRILTGK